MRSKYIITLLIGLLATAQPLVAKDGIRQIKSIVILPGSIRIGGVELRSASKQGTSRYISLAAAERVLGHPSNEYRAGLGVLVYSWRLLGIELQKGWRGPEKGKLFKFQVFLHDDYNRGEDKHTGTFSGHVRVDGLDISTATKFDSIRRELEKQGYNVKTEAGSLYAEKGAITIFTTEPSNKLTAGTTNEIARVEVWCE